jgi:PAS domain S-box-containing protein
MMAEKLRILYVDDEPTLLDVGRILLEESGNYSVTTVESAPAALELLKNEQFDAIVSDYMMPDMDGIRFLVEVRARFGPVPFIMFTGKGEKEEVIQAINNGADFYLQKGDDAELQFVDLSHKIRQAVSRRRAEEALRETNAYLNNLFDYANAPIITWDPGFHITRVNHAFVHLTGKNQEEMLGKTLDSLFPRETHKASMTLIQIAFKGERWENVEIPILTKEGTIRTVIWNSATVHDLDGTIVSTIAQGVDITERKRAEEALLQAHKQLNMLSSITRHDILNQLMALKGYLYLSNEMIDDPTALKEYIQKEEQVADAIERQITFTKDYQDLGAAAPAWQNVNACIKKAVAGLPMRNIHVEFDPKNPEVFADPLFEKVFSILIDNALKYGGEMMTAIRLSSQESSRGLMIICEDDGVGITVEDKKRLFTRGFGKSTGLGLFLSREILSITGITITENGVPGKGARFEITVPKKNYIFKNT